MILHNAITLVATFFMLLALLGCNQKQPTSVELVFGLRSYSSVNEVESRVVQEGGKWNVVENTTLNTSDARPQYEYIQVETDIFNDAGYKGKTLLSFYNGKLMSVWFYANDWGNYKKYLEKKRGVVIKNDMWEEESGNARSWLAIDHEARYYIAWEDITLANSMKEWIEKYS